MQFSKLQRQKQKLEKQLQDHHQAMQQRIDQSFMLSILHNPLFYYTFKYTAAQVQQLAKKKKKSPSLTFFALFTSFLLLCVFTNLSHLSFLFANLSSSSSSCCVVVCHRLITLCLCHTHTQVIVPMVVVWAWWGTPLFVGPATLFWPLVSSWLALPAWDNGTIGVVAWVAICRTTSQTALSYIHN